MPWIPPEPDPEVARDWRRALIDMAIVLVLIAITAGVLAILIVTR